MNPLISSVLLLVISLCTHMGFAAADPATTTVWSYCGQYEYRNSSAFQRSLDKVLDSLTRNVYLSGFNTSSVVVGGQNNNSRVYGLVQCRGDLSSSDCKLCASAARAKLVQGCYNTSGLIQLEGCFLRYEYHNFYNDYDESGPASVLCNTENSSQPQQFTNTVKDAVLNITNTAANSPKLFAAHAVAAPYNSSQHIYSLAQCWRDMSPINCGSCLTSALSYIFLCQKGALGSQFGSMNCYLRSEVYAFYNASNLPTSPEGKNGNNRLQSHRESPSVSKAKRSKVPGMILGVVSATLGLIAAIGLWKCNIFYFRTRWEQICGTRGSEIA